MKEIILNESNEMVVNLITNVLQGYCGTIYSISGKQPETAMNILTREMLSEILYDILFACEVEKYVKSGSGKDVSEINMDELKKTIIYWHKEHIIELVLKKIKPDDADECIYWKLKMAVSQY